MRNAPLCAFFCAYRTSENATHIYPLHHEEVARIAFASTALQIPGDDENLANAISVCTRATGAFELALGIDRTGVSAAIEDFLAAPLSMPDLALQPVWEKPGTLKRISVIIPVYNMSHLISEAISSIAAQHYPDIEVIVVDDGSTDELDQVLETVGFPVRLIRQTHCGPSAARNAGIAAATGEWLAFLDADDMWEHGALLRLARDLVLHSRAGVVHGKAISFLLDEQSGEHLNAMQTRENFPFFIGAGIYQRSAFDVVGGFAESLTFSEDVEWYARASDLIQVVEIPDIILRVRMHAGNMTADTIADHMGRFQAMKSVFAHRRKLAAQEAYE
jgi:GT2 family glycosyltransferase